MRGLLMAVLISGMAFGQAAEEPKPADTSAPQSPAAATTATPKPAPTITGDPNAVTIPAGTKIP